MCLGIPGKVVEVFESEGIRMSRVDFGGVSKEACLEYLPEVGVGDYVIVHVGFAISHVNEEEARYVFKLLEGDLSELDAGTEAVKASLEKSAAQMKDR
jgi:hydrogenase expression/formation protein HypC